MSVKNSSHVLSQLRALMKNMAYVTEPLQAYIIPTGDYHQSEYVAPCDHRRAFVSGFTGSAGTAVITDKKAALWTDGRYYLQAEKQLDNNWILMKDGLTDTPTQAAWLSKILPVASKVGVDPFLLSVERWKPLAKELKSNGHVLIPVTENLVDLMWKDRPEPPNNPLIVLSQKYTGLSWQDKVKKVRDKMHTKDVGAIVITALDEVAWLFNLRGSDIEYNPVFYAYAMVTFDGVYLFIDESKLDNSVNSHLCVGATLSTDSEITVEIHPYEDVNSFITCHAEVTDRKIWISEKSSYGITNLIPKPVRLTQTSAVAVLKCVKNETEIKGAKKAHVKDAVAMCEFMHWLENEVPKGTVTEISAADKVAKLRSQQDEFMSLSFDTISSIGADAAIIHYKPTPESDKPITTDQIYLCDSGAQYKDGTTDITRTIHLGTPSKYEQECFTRVLKGHIKLSTTVFPNGIKGHNLDSLARTALWDVGLEYLHGTGHGVGSFLNVHEGPCGISPKVSAGEIPLEAGMILSDEPGYYENEKFGVRIENCVLVVKTETKYNFQKRGFLTFEPLTLVPMQTKMIDPSLLTQQEIDWLNDYHDTCLQLVGEELKSQGKTQVLKWLKANTQSLG
ncbi:xaa-Pro aminopeptidase 1-like [Gigantopelta aegis]|uniref:xaa-Pro aminopeptidase 1-like n=1 Tax=Gigantopelta aegis TaxID=1735272 RepID=UPI001B88C924|nr:xaa-Pro aminopeptidase 1-like [Gigantopelta aegis]XP_041369027.1 xaa-Pro aminopeptidase 1-like [Gigantopelta aegis]XP_041369028.1 xaa-Pro aminopeptidase 1-like [Gigantopelta aegis]